MRTVTFNDDIVLTLPYGWESREFWEDGKRALRIAGPCASSRLSDSEEYQNDLNLSIKREMEKPLSEMDFSARLRKASDAAPDVSISISFSSSRGYNSGRQLGGSGFERGWRVLIDQPHLKTGWFSMGILGKTACMGVIVTEKYLYLLTVTKSEKIESGWEYLPKLLESAALARPLTPAELEARRLAGEKAERERLEREATERARENEQRKQMALEKQARADRERQKREIERRRESELNEKLAQFEKTQKAEIEKRYQNAKNAAKEKLNEARKKEHAAREKLSASGFFDFGVKREQKDIVKKAQEKASAAEAELERAEKTLADELGAMAERISEQKAILMRELASKYPLPGQPAEAAVPVVRQRNMATIRTDIRAFMEPDTLYTAEDIIQYCPSAAAVELTKKEAESILASMCRMGILEKTVHSGRTFYNLA